MKTIPLNDLLNRVARDLPLEPNWQTPRVVFDNDHEALIVHSVNQHAKLVATLTELLDVSEDLKASVDYAEGFSSPPAIFTAAREVLRAANEVQLPD